MEVRNGVLHLKQLNSQGDTISIRGSHIDYYRIVHEYGDRFLVILTNEGNEFPVSGEEIDDFAQWYESD